jgi:hypothetical protein
VSRSVTLANRTSRPSACRCAGVADAPVHLQSETPMLAAA